MKRFLDGYTKIIKKVCYNICYCSMAMVACMMLLMFVDAMMGLFFNVRIVGSYELVQCMLSILVFSSWAYTQTEHGHINVVMFVRMMPHKLRFICFGFTSVLSTVIMGIAGYAVFQMILAKMANGESTGTLLIPYWPFYVFELAAFVLLAIGLLCDALKAVAAIFDKQIAEQVMADWV